MRAPLIIGSVMRATEINSANRMRQVPFRALADVLIEPALENYAILAFEQYAPIIDIGYAATKAQVASWQSAARPRRRSSRRCAAARTMLSTPAARRRCAAQSPPGCARDGREARAPGRAFRRTAVRRRAGGALRPADPAAAPRRRSRRPLVDRRRHRGVRRRVGLHQAVRAPRAQGAGGLGADHRSDRQLLRVDPCRRVRQRRQPAQVRRRRAAAVVPGRGPRRAGVPRRRADAARAARRRPDRRAGRQGHAADVAGRAHGPLPLLHGGHVRITSCCRPDRRGAASFRWSTWPRPARS